MSALKLKKQQVLSKKLPKVANRSSILIKSSKDKKVTSKVTSKTSSSSLSSKKRAILVVLKSRELLHKKSEILRFRRVKFNHIRTLLEKAAKSKEEFNDTVSIKEIRNAILKNDDKQLDAQLNNASSASQNAETQKTSEPQNQNQNDQSQSDQTGSKTDSSQKDGDQPNPSSAPQELDKDAERSRIQLEKTPAISAGSAISAFFASSIEFVRIMLSSKQKLLKEMPEDERNLFTTKRVNLRALKEQKMNENRNASASQIARPSTTPGITATSIRHTGVIPVINQTAAPQAGNVARSAVSLPSQGGAGADQNRRSTQTADQSSSQPKPQSSILQPQPQIGLTQIDANKNLSTIKTPPEKRVGLKPIQSGASIPAPRPAVDKNLISKTLSPMNENDGEEFGNYDDASSAKNAPKNAIDELIEDFENNADKPNKKKKSKTKKASKAKVKNKSSKKDKYDSDNELDIFIENATESENGENDKNGKKGKKGKKSKQNKQDENSKTASLELPKPVANQSETQNQGESVSVGVIPQKSQSKNKLPFSINANRPPIVDASAGVSLSGVSLSSQNQGVQVGNVSAQNQGVQGGQISQIGNASQAGNGALQNQGVQVGQGAGQVSASAGFVPAQSQVPLPSSATLKPVPAPNVQQTATTLTQGATLQSAQSDQLAIGQSAPQAPVQPGQVPAPQVTNLEAPAPKTPQSAQTTQTAAQSANSQNSAETIALLQNSPQTAQQQQDQAGAQSQATLQNAAQSAQNAAQPQTALQPQTSAAQLQSQEFTQTQSTTQASPQPQTAAPTTQQSQTTAQAQTTQAPQAPQPRSLSTMASQSIFDKLGIRPSYMDNPNYVDSEKAPQFDFNKSANELKPAASIKPVNSSAPVPRPNSMQFDQFDKSPKLTVKEQIRSSLQKTEFNPEVELNKMMIDIEAESRIAQRTIDANSQSAIERIEASIDKKKIPIQFPKLNSDQKDS